MKNKILKSLLTEDWVIVGAGALILALAAVFPDSMPSMPQTLATGADWLSAGYMFLFVLILTYLTSAVLGRPLKWIFPLIPADWNLKNYLPHIAYQFRMQPNTSNQQRKWSHSLQSPTDR